MVSDSVARKRDALHAFSSAVAIGSLVLSTAFVATGCGSKKQEVDKPAVAEINNTINDGTFETTATLDCAEGKSLNIGGSENTLTVKGRCDSVVIGGDDNDVNFEEVTTELTVAGLNNTVTYREGNPNIQDLGTGNTITQG